MPFKFNPITGVLDLVEAAGSGSGNVTGVPPTNIGAIAQWADTSGTTIANSPGTFVQASGAIEAQGFITNRTVSGTVTVNSGESWIAPALTVAPGGVIVLDSDS